MTLRSVSDLDHRMAADGSRLHVNSPCLRCGARSTLNDGHGHDGQWVRYSASEGKTGFDGQGFAPVCDLDPEWLARRRHPTGTS